MLVIIRSAPDTVEGKRGVKTARSLSADVVLLQNAVYFAQKDRLDGFRGTAYVLEEDCRLRGLADTDIVGGIKQIGYDELVDLMADDEKVVGTF